MNDRDSRSRASRFLLLDFLDDSLDKIEDARERQRALASAGFDTRAIAVRELSAASAGEPEAESRIFRRVDPDDWSEVLREAAGEWPGASLLVCGGHDGRAEAAARRWKGETRSWPTRLTGHADADRHAIDLALAARVQSVRSRTSLWDGKYLLAPSPLAGPAGRALLDAFADIADEHDMLDLVALGELSPELGEHARESGVALRVHGAGEAPLRAECTWLAGASAVIVGAGPLPGVATLLRALEGPAPLVVMGREPAPRALADWLGSRGALVVPDGTDASAAKVLRCAIDRTAESRAAVSAGAAFSSRHTVESVAAILRARFAAAPVFRAAA
jgi:hypothetical protein